MKEQEQERERERKSEKERERKRGRERERAATGLQLIYYSLTEPLPCFWPSFNGRMNWKTFGVTCHTAIYCHIVVKKCFQGLWLTSLQSAEGKQSGQVKNIIFLCNASFPLALNAQQAVWPQ
jgi:hypothetical protein